jgi:hypothetical protein
MDSMKGAVVSPGNFGYEEVRVRILTAGAPNANQRTSTLATGYRLLIPSD